MRDDTIMKVKDMKLEAQSLFLGVCVHNYAPSRVEGLHRRFPLAWINRKNYKYYSHPILKSMSLTYEYGNNLAYCLFEHAKENEELRLELKSILMGIPEHKKMYKELSKIVNVNVGEELNKKKNELLFKGLYNPLDTDTLSFARAEAFCVAKYIFDLLDVEFDDEKINKLHKKWSSLVHKFFTEDEGKEIWARNMITVFEKMSDKTILKKISAYNKQYSEYLEQPLAKYIDDCLYTSKNIESMTFGDTIAKAKNHMLGMNITKRDKITLTTAEINEILLVLITYHQYYSLKSSDETLKDLFDRLNNDKKSIMKFMEKDKDEIINELIEYPDELDDELLDVLDTHFISFVSSYITAKFHNENREAYFNAKSNTDVISLNSLEQEMKKFKKELKLQKQINKQLQTELNTAKDTARKETQNKLKDSQQQIVELNRKNQRLTEENKEYLQNNTQLREMVETLLIKVQEQEHLLEQIPATEESLTVDHLNRSDILIIGGHPHVLAKLRERLPNCKFCECRRTYKDDFFKGVKYAYVFVEWINHGMTGKLNKICPYIPKRVIAATNPERILREMNEIYMEDMKYEQVNVG